MDIASVETLPSAVEPESMPALEVAVQPVTECAFSLPIINDIAASAVKTATAASAEIVAKVKKVSTGSKVSNSAEKSKELLRNAIRATSEYNAHLNTERREERQISMDLQTYTVHYPLGLGVENRQLQRFKRQKLSGKINRNSSGRYPVSVLPGQYQDWYMPYTSEELKYFPLNSVIYGPIVTDPSKLPPLLTSAEEGSISESDSDSLSDDDLDTCSGVGGHSGRGMDGNFLDSNHNKNSLNNLHHEECDDSSSSGSSSSSDSEIDGPPPAPTLMKERKPRPNAICNVCKGSAGSNKLNLPEELVHCFDCDKSAHPSCLQLSLEMVDVIKSYHWQCMDCKTCVHCSQPHNEDKMMFCDKCDRGYHTFCVGLKIIPTGKWVCRLCAQCAQCGITDPGADAGWQHETIKIISPNGETLRRHQLFCNNCYKKRKAKINSS